MFVSWPILVILGIGFCLLGMVVGSFLNVCIYRIPWEKSVIWPASHCPNCLAEIQKRDNLPVLGWVMLGGSCRSCHVPISIRYPLIEFLVGLLFLGVYLADGVLPVQYVRDDEVLAIKVIYHVLLVSLLVAVTFIDQGRQTLSGSRDALILPWVLVKPSNTNPNPDPPIVTPNPVRPAAPTAPESSQPSRSARRRAPTARSRARRDREKAPGIACKCVASSVGDRRKRTA